MPATYPQVTLATVELTQSAWRRIEVDGKPHDHAFATAGPRRRYAKAVLGGGQPGHSLVGGVRDLEVLKTTASEWRNFVDDRYRTLEDAADRILATRVDADWAYNAESADCPAIDSIRFELPNQHRVPFSLDPFGLKFENDIYVATAEPYGPITGTIARAR